MARYVDDRSGLGVIGQVSLAVSDFVERVQAGLAWSASFRETYEELDRLSDRDLNDLGIGRSDITRIAREAADNAAAAR